MSKQNPRKAYAYIRVSGRGQVSGGGFDRQEQAIRAYGKSHRTSIVEWYRDAGVSGAKLASERPGLSAMIEAILMNGVRTVLIERSDRLARKLTVSEALLAEFAKFGVQVIACDTGSDLVTDDADDPMKKALRQMVGVMAELDKDMTVLKLRAGRAKKKRETGRCEGRLPFGEYEGEPETLARMRQLRRKRKGRVVLSYAKIAAKLNAEDLSTRSGRPWIPVSVRQILCYKAPKPTA